MKKRFREIAALALALTLGLGLLSGCTGREEDATGLYVDRVELETELEEEAVALAASPAALPTVLKPEAPGTKKAKTAKAVVDYSNASDGYIMARYTARTDRRLKAKVTGPSGVGYQYNLTQGEWATLPLSDGNGKYEVKVYEHTGKENKYAPVATASFDVKLADEFAPFLRPNQYVDYTEAENTLAKAQELVGEETNALVKVEKVYDYVVDTLTYDKERAANVQKGYLPVLDSVLAEKKGICFDYAALMTAMLRCQGVPCKLVVGYAGEAYHAWISVWSETEGWVDAAIFFDGESWQRMDPTFASSGKRSAAIQEYIGDGSHYSAMYFY